MKVTLVYNPGAGTDEQLSADELLGMIRRAGHTAILKSAKNDDWSSVLERPGDIVAVAGGDGTVGKVANCLLGKDIPIAVLPLGTANNIELAHLEDPEEKLTSVLQMLKDRLQNPPVKKLKVTLDGRDVSGEYVLLEVMNL